MIDDEISEAFPLTSKTRHYSLLLLLFNVLLKAFGQEKEMRSYKIFERRM